MGIKRIVDTDFWDDSKVIDMFSSEDKYFMLYLLTNPHTTQLGIYELNTKKAAFELGYSKDVVGVLLERFENKYEMIKYSSRTNEIAIKNFLRHSIVKGGKPVEDLLIKELKNVKDRSLISYVFGSLKQYEGINETVKRLIILLNDNDNDNDNENEVSYHDTYHESYNESSEDKKPQKEPKHKHGAFMKVLLTDTEKNKLINEIGQEMFDKCIKKLDEYIETTGKKYKNHNLVIRNWVIDAVKQQKAPQQPQPTPKQTTNKFNNHEQRNYSAQDMADLERKLLNKGL